MKLALLATTTMMAANTAPIANQENLNYISKLEINKILEQAEKENVTSADIDEMKNNNSLLQWQKEFENAIKNSNFSFDCYLEKLSGLNLPKNQMIFMVKNAIEKLEIEGIKIRESSVRNIESRRTGRRVELPQVGSQSMRIGTGEINLNPMTVISQSIGEGYRYNPNDRDDVQYLKSHIDGDQFVRLKENNLMIPLSGKTNNDEAYHDFLPDVTIINWSNQYVYDETIKDYANNAMSDDILSMIANDIYSGNVTDKATEINKIALSLQNEIVKHTLESNLKNSKLLTGLKGLEKISTFATLFENVNNLINSLTDERGSEDLAKSSLSSLVDLSTIGLAALGPYGAISAALLELTIKTVPTKNGYTISENTGDHGLNDFKYQMLNNRTNMIRTAASFSENFTHGVSWMVEDGWFSLPKLWIRPGQTSLDPWVPVSEEYFSVNNKNVRTFVFGVPIEEQSYHQISELRKMWLGKNGFNLFDEQIIWTKFYEGTNDITFNVNPGGVEYSDNNRYYNINWMANVGGRSAAFEAAMHVHENDHDNDSSVKLWNWEGTIPGEGIEITEQSIGKIFLKFQDNNIREFTNMSERYSEAFRNAKYYANDVLSGKGVLLEDIPAANAYKHIDPSKNYRVKYYLSKIKVGETRFNTYDDRGWDDTHSDYFRFNKVEIGIKTVIEEVN